MKHEKILILGGNGKTGRRVVNKLVKRGVDSVRIGSRGATPAFHWDKPESWSEVLAGIDAAYITFQPDLAIPSAVELIDRFASLAKASGVRKMVLLSGRGEKEAQACEQIIIKTATNWTIVRASWFNQNFSEGFFLDPILDGHVALPRADALEPFTDAEDIADVVVETLLNDSHDGEVYELTGPRLMTFPQAITEIARAAGRDIEFQNLTLDEYVQSLRTFGLPEDELWLVNYLFAEVLDGRNSSVTSDIERVLGRRPTDFSEYAKVTAASGAWNQREAIVKSSKTEKL